MLNYLILQNNKVPIMYLKTLSVIAASLLIVGCSVKIQPYYSEANETYTSSSIKTSLSGIAGDNEALSYPQAFGVINAIDNDMTRYTLIVPTYDDQAANGDPTLSLYNFHHAAFLTLTTLPELITAVDDAIQDWNTVYPPEKAQNISYLSGSEKSAVDFHYQNGAAGEAAFVNINSGENVRIVNDDDSISVVNKVYHYEIRDLEELKGFSYLLHKALKGNSEEVTVDVVDNNTTATDDNTTTPDSNTTLVENNTTTPVVVEDLNITQAPQNDFNTTATQEQNTSIPEVTSTPEAENNNSVTTPSTENNSSTTK